MGSPSLTYRRFGNLIAWLPDDSALKRAMHQDMEDDGSPDEQVDVGSWPLGEQLLANIVDLLAVANWQRTSGKGSKPKMLTGKPRRSAKPDAGVGDVRDLLSQIAPPANGQSQPDSD